MHLEGKPWKRTLKNSFNWKHSLVRREGLEANLPRKNLGAQPREEFKPLLSYEHIGYNQIVGFPWRLQRPCWLTIWLKTRNTISFNFEIWIIFLLCLQTKPNQFSVSYHIAQYTNIIADLRKEIFRLKLKISEHGEESGDGSSRKSKPLPRGVCWQANMSRWWWWSWWF